MTSKREPFINNEDKSNYVSRDLTLTITLIN